MKDIDLCWIIEEIGSWICFLAIWIVVGASFEFGKQLVKKKI